MRRCTCLIGLLALGFVAGCGGGFTPDAGVVVTGKVVQGGQPIAITGGIPGYGYVEVQLINVATSTQVGSAHCDASGAFEITGAGAGIPPGKYKVAIKALKDPGTDLLGGKMNETTTKFEVEVPQGKTGGKHDLGTIEVNDHLK